MNVFRNREIRRPLIGQTVIAAVACVIAFSLDWRCGAVTLCLALILIGIFWVVTSRRYRKIQELSRDIDRILHGKESETDLSAYREGDLAALQSEINKMTIRLREQRTHLQEDKEYLANMIADFSHQIRTPLTSIHLLVSFLSEEKLDDKRRIELTRQLLSLLMKIDWLTSGMLKLSQLDAGTVRLKRETVPLDDLLRQSVQPFLVGLELHSVNLVRRADGDFTGDVAWTAEAIGNIVKNCLEHLDDGGDIEMTAHQTPLYTEITVADTGSGIDEEDLPHIFERFYKGRHASGSGFGIGLALARAIVVAQNGTIKAENRSPHGALFTLRFYRDII